MEKLINDKFTELEALLREDGYNMENVVLQKLMELKGATSILLAKKEDTE